MSGKDGKIVIAKILTLKLAVSNVDLLHLGAVDDNRLSTVNNRAFPVVAARMWNDLPSDVMSAESLSTFRQRLKTHLASKSFPGYILHVYLFFLDIS